MPRSAPVALPKPDRDMLAPSSTNSASMNQWRMAGVRSGGARCLARTTVRTRRTQRWQVGDRPRDICIGDAAEDTADQDEVGR
jgi:hypothetical protein